MSEYPDTPNLPVIDLDPSLYDPSREEVDFLKSQTGIKNDEELKQHVLSVQREAWSVSSVKQAPADIVFNKIRQRLSIIGAFKPLDL